MNERKEQFENLFYKGEKKDDSLFENNWNILIVDDEKDIHTITINALDRFHYNNSGLNFISCYSAKEAEELLTHRNDISIILLDVVMEHKSAGLDLVKFIRNEIKNELIQIILRTGHPGEAPEREVIEKYEINDYKTKTELTQNKLWTAIRTCLRAYELLKDKELYEKELENRIKERTDEINQIFNVSTPLIQIDTNYKILKVNESFKKLFQIEGELIGKNCHETLGCLKHGTNECSIHKLTQKKIESTSYEASKIFPDGTELIYEVKAIPIKDEQGNITSIVENVVDITKLKIAESIIRKERNQLRALIDNIPSFIYIKDLDGKYIIANEKLYTVASKLWKAKGNMNNLPENLIGLCDHDFYPGKMAGRFLKDDYEVIVTGSPIVNKLEKGLDENLKEIKVLTTKVPLKNDTGEIVGLVCTGRDITEIKKNIAQLIYEDIEELRETLIEFDKELDKAKTKAKTAEEQNKLKSEFLSQVSHDVRTPISSILLNTDIIKKGIKESEFSANLDSIETSSSVLIDLIDGILTFSVLREGKLETNSEPTNVASIIKEIEHIFKIPIENKGMKFIINIDENLPGSLLLDQKRIRQILINLLSNAQKYTENGHIDFTTRINITSESTIDLIFEVEDTGLGIPRDKQEKIFTAFEMIREVHRGGIGLGLSIVKQLVDMMGGTIELISKEGKGSKFTVVLPNVKISNEQPEIFMKFETKNIVFEKGILLIADDTYTVRQNIKRIFEGTEINVIEAVNGKEAVKEIEDTVPDLVLMDIVMPEMGGLKATKIIKSNEKLKDIPIIAYTASMKMDEFKEDINLFDGYISKTNKDVVGEIFKVVQKYVKHKELETVVSFDVEKEFAEIPERLISDKSFKSELEELRNEWENKGLHKSFNKGKAFEFGHSIERVGNKYNFGKLEYYGSLFYSTESKISIATIKRLVNKFHNIYSIITSKLN